MTQVCWHHPYTTSWEWCPSDGWSWCLALELCLACLQQVLSTCAVITYKAQQLHLPLADIWGHWLQLALQNQGPLCCTQQAHIFTHQVRAACASLLPQRSHAFTLKSSRLNTGLKCTQCDRHLRPLQAGSVFAPTGLGGLLLGQYFEYQ